MVVRPSSYTTKLVLVGRWLWASACTVSSRTPAPSRKPSPPSHHPTIPPSHHPTDPPSRLPAFLPCCWHWACSLPPGPGTDGITPPTCTEQRLRPPDAPKRAEGTTTTSLSLPSPDKASEA
ncbi:hypothetical protein MDA_GLEAN10008933 [Myotis davidii]|uniref:Secreted protein n=1 Tax=Myotis davidii TaxID=225400 RepID=L5M6V8_MYODS|nr:hypothetical protein MDA_GLEAN10008933 [Myotis davidii]